jgi:hypothetical protein
MVLQSTEDKNLLENRSQSFSVGFGRIMTYDKHSLSSKPQIAFKARVGFSFLHVVLFVEKRTDSNSNLIFDPLKLHLVLMPWEYASPVEVLYSSINPVNVVVPWMSKVMCIHSSNGGADIESI